MARLESCKPAIMRTSANRFSAVAAHASSVAASFLGITREPILFDVFLRHAELLQLFPQALNHRLGAGDVEERLLQIGDALLDGCFVQTLRMKEVVNP